jgi:hypothetical protein
VRSVVAFVAGFLAVVGIVAGSIGLWARSTVLDSGRFARTVYDLLGDPEIADALAVRVTDDVIAASQLDDRVTTLVPDALQPVTSFLAAGAKSWIQDRVSALIQNDDVRAGIATAAGRAHQQLVDLIEGDGLVDGISIKDDAVTLNLLPLTARALTVVQDLGLLRDVDIPTLERGGDPDEQRAELEAALGRDLPPDFGELVVFRSGTVEAVGGVVETAQRALVATTRAIWLLLVLGLGLAVVSVWLAARRPRAAAIVAGSTVVAYIAVRLATRYVVHRAASSVDGAGAQHTVDRVLSGYLDSLTSSTVAYVAIACMVVVTAVLVGRSRQTTS